MSQNSGERRAPLSLRAVVATLVAGVFAGILVTPAPAQGAPLDNDDFSAAIVIEGESGSVAGSNERATTEPGEPLHAGSGSASVWFTWTAPDAGGATFDTFGSDFDTVLAVYRGETVDGLTLVADNDDASGLQSEVRFATAPGVTYAIAVAGFEGATGAFTLRWAWHPAPVNDHFVSATVIDGVSGSVPGTTLGATIEPGEPHHTDGDVEETGSVWFTWTAPQSGPVEFEISDSPTTNPLAVYTGETIDALTPIVDNGGFFAPRVTFHAVEGARYAVVVAARFGEVGDFTLGWAMFEPPANDTFATATVIGGASGTLSGSNDNATTEAGEPKHAGNGTASVWFSWTPPTTGAATFDTFGSEFDTTLAVYTGDRVDALALVGANDDTGAPGTSHRNSRVVFRAEHGTTYQIAVAGFFGAQGVFTLHWALGELAAGDAFAGPITIADASGTTSGTNEGATTEPGEPAHTRNAAASVWFSWSAPGDGIAVLDTFGSGFDTILAVYTGPSLDALTLVAQDDDTGGRQSQVSFDVTAGTQYAIALAGDDGATGPYTFTWALHQQAGNDAFDSATPIDGERGMVAGHNHGATAEPGEPLHAGFGSKSVWFSWTAPADHVVTFDTDGSALDTALAVYTGDAVGSLREIVQNDDDFGTTQSRVVFPATAGDTYRIAIVGERDADGSFVLNWAFRDPPPNDDFAAAASLAGVEGSLQGTTVLATAEPGEPTHGGFGGSSVWFTWTAPTDGVATIDTLRSDELPAGDAFNTVLAVYTGASVSDLTEVAVNDNDADRDPASRVVFPARQGTSYAVAVAGFRAFTGEYVLSWTLTDPLPNDDFADAAPLAGESGAVTGSTVGATKEPGEPFHDRFAQPSVWFSWTAPADGVAAFDTAGSGFHTVLAAYTGDRVDDLELIAEDGGSSLDTDTRIETPVQGGTTYRVAVAGFDGETGPFALTWLFRPTTPPANDAFADAAPLGGVTGTFTGTTEGATSEPGEPLDGGPRTASAWFTYTAPADGVVTFDTRGSEFDTVLSAYTGDAVDQLRFVAANGLSCCLHSEVDVSVREGGVYRIATFGFNGARGPLILNWRLDHIEVPPNDDFANPTAITGIEGGVSGTNAGASSELDEPLHPGAGTASVWLSWTAPEDGAFHFTTRGRTGGSAPTLDTNLAVYTGDAVGDLTEVVANHSPAGLPAELTVRAVAGTTYRIAVTGARGDMGEFRLDWRKVTPPANDDFADARPLRGRDGTVSQALRFATIEPGEPDHAGVPGGASVWFTWRATIGGRVGFDTYGSNPFNDTHMAVYTGRRPFDTPELVAADDDAPGGGRNARVEFTARPGTLYFIAVDTFYGDTNRGITLAWRPAPDNDAFASAQVLEGRHGEVEETTLVASAEPGEPARIGGGGASIWHRWTATADGIATFDTNGSRFDTTLSIYTGSSLSDLELVTEVDNFVAGFSRAFTPVEVTRGTTYFIAVDGVRHDGDDRPEAGPVTLSWTGPPANDDIADAEELAGDEGHTLALPGGTRERGEPDHAGQDGTLWFRWTASRDGSAAFDTIGSEQSTRDACGGSAVVDYVLAVYTRTADGTFHRVAWNDDLSYQTGESAVALQALAGETYWLAVQPSAVGGSGCAVQLNWKLT